MPVRSLARVSFVLFAAAAALHAQNADIDAHIAAAKAAAKADHAVLFTSLCSAEPTGPGTGRRGAGAGQPGGPPPGPPAKESWHAEPMKVFDNLYFIGMKDVSAWAVNTSEGIIILDALYDYSVDDEIAEGLRKVGLKPENIKYAIVSHGHGDHSGGAKYLQDRFKARVLLSELDWGLLDRGRGTRPARRKFSTTGSVARKYVPPNERVRPGMRERVQVKPPSWLIPKPQSKAPPLVAKRPSWNVPTRKSGLVDERIMCGSAWARWVAGNCSGSTTAQ
jgi:hypothetical protein